MREFTSYDLLWGVPLAGATIFYLLETIPPIIALWFSGRNPPQDTMDEEWKLQQAKIEEQEMANSINGCMIMLVVGFLLLVICLGVVFENR